MLVFIATAEHSSSAAVVPSGQIPPGWIAAAFKPLNASYLVALGFPLVAAVAARVIVGARTSSGSLQKTEGQQASLVDVVTDDQGNLDLIDFQYTLFNVITIVFVLTQFCPHPAQGFPEIPGVLATLSGLSAAVYTGNKAAITNPARIDRILNPTVSAGGQVNLVGSNLVVDATDAEQARRSTLITLTHASLASPDPVSADQVSSNEVMFTVPVNTAPGANWTIGLQTNAGGSAVHFDGLTVVAATTADKTAAPGSRIGGIGVQSSR